MGALSRFSSNKSKAVTYATLWIYSDSISPDEVTRKLGITPTDIYVKGIRRLSRQWPLVRLPDGSVVHQQRAYAPYKRHGWRLQTSETDPSLIRLEDHLRALLDQIRAAGEMITSLNHQADVEIFVELYWLEGRELQDASLDLSPRDLAELKDLGVPVLVTINQHFDFKHELRWRARLTWTLLKGLFVETPRKKNRALRKDWEAAGHPVVPFRDEEEESS